MGKPRIPNNRRRLLADCGVLVESELVDAGSGMLELHHRATERRALAKRTLWARFTTALLLRIAGAASVIGLHGFAYTLRWAARRPGLFSRLRTLLKTRAALRENEKRMRQNQAYFEKLKRYGDG
jgi:hypothetical protein